MPAERMKLSKTIPARRYTITATWLRRDYIEMSPRFREIRRDDKMCRCFWCNHNFEDGEKMSMGHVDGKGNRNFCDRCARQLSESATED